MMSSNDELDDILVEIKKRKEAAGSSERVEDDIAGLGSENESAEVRRLAIEERLFSSTAPAGWSEKEGTDVPLSAPADTGKTERISRQLARQTLPAAQGRKTQDQQWDALWQSVAVKKKKPELYDYEAEEKEYLSEERASTPSQEVSAPRPAGQREPQRDYTAPSSEKAPPVYRQPRRLSEERGRSVPGSAWVEGSSVEAETETVPERPLPIRRPASAQTQPERQEQEQDIPRPKPPEEREESLSHRTRQFRLTIPDLDETVPAQTEPASEPEPEEEEFILEVSDPSALREGRRNTPEPSPKEPPAPSRRPSLFGDMNRSIFDSMEESDDSPEEPPTAPTIDPEEEEQLHSRRKSKVSAFFAKKEFDVDTDEGEIPGDDEDEDTERPAVRLGRGRLRESFGPNSEGDIKDRLQQTRTGVLIRMGISAAIFILLFWFHMSKVHRMPSMPHFMWPEVHPLTFIAINFGLLLTAALVNASIVGGGLLSLFTLKPDNDSLTALSVVASIVQCAVLTIMPEYVMDTKNVQLYCFIPALALTLSNVGRFMCVNRVDRGSRIVSGSYDKYAIIKVENEDLARELTRGMDIEEPSVAVSVKTDKLTEYDETAYASDFSENISRILAPICLAASILVSVAGYFLSEAKSSLGALTAFAALTAVCSPLTASIAANMPLGRMSKLLHKEGSMLAGYQAADEFSDVSAVVLDATDLFTEKDVTLFTVKPFAEKRIDEALLDAASLICSTRSTLTGIFSNIIQGQKSLLHPVENIVYEDGMGLSAWVNKKRVLIGNRALMQHYGIDTPSRDFEAKYCRDHRDILYLSNSGELSAMFVLGYSVNEEAAEMLHSLMDQNITIAVSVNDPNVTAEKICRLYEFPMEDIRIIPAQAQEALRLYCRPREHSRAEAAHMGSTASMVHAVCAAYSVKTAVVLATMIQFIGVFLGYAALTFFVFTGSFASITPDLLGIYLAIWSVLVIAIPRLRKI